MSASVSVNTLSGMPGDKIKFHGAEGFSSGVIRSSGWQPSPNGGRVWTYELTTGELVPNTAVTEIEKYSDEGASSKPYVSRQQEFMQSLDEMDLPPILKTAIHCLMMNTLKDLEVAHHLIGTRIRQLYELELASSSVVGENNT